MVNESFQLNQYNIHIALIIKKNIECLYLFITYMIHIEEKHIFADTCNVFSKVALNPTLHLLDI